jgi:VanZ family protein
LVPDTLVSAELSYEANCFERGKTKLVVYKLIRLRAAQLHWRPNLLMVLLLLWGLFIIYATMLPFDFSASDDLIRSRLRRLWERPLRGGGGSWADVCSNVLLFMPWGLLLAMWQAGRGSSWLWALALSLLSGACLSGTVEVVQFFAPRRQPSFVDLVTNTFGSVAGALIGWPLARWFWPVASIRIRQLLIARPVAACALAATAGLVIAGLSPTYVRMVGSVVASSLKTARLIPFGASLGGPSPAAKACLWGAELLTWTLAGGLFALAARESGRHGVGAMSWAVAPAGGLSLAIEAIQVVIPGRDVDLTSVVLALAGSALGAAPVARSAGGDARRWIMPALTIWGVAALLAAWNPPRFTWPDPPFWRPEMLVPFWSYFGSRSLDDLADVIGQAMVFVPLGVLLAACSWRQSFLAAVLIGLGFGVVLELGQVFLPDRKADVSDAISAAAGAGVGLALWRWGESVRTSSLGVTRYRVGRHAGRKG